MDFLYPKLDMEKGISTARLDSERPKVPVVEGGGEVNVNVSCAAKTPAQIKNMDNSPVN